MLVFDTVDRHLLNMRLLRVFLDGYQAVSKLEFEAGPFTVLFGLQLLSVAARNPVSPQCSRNSPYDLRITDRQQAAG